MKVGRIEGITWLAYTNCAVFLEFVLLLLELLAAPVGSRVDQAVLDDQSLTVVLARIFHPNRIKDILRDGLTPCRVGVK